MKYWEDFKLGERAELGRHTFSEQEIVAFGRQYDPQPFHIDAEKARASAFGGLIASGWQTCAVGMRLMVDAYINQTVSLGSPGIDKADFELFSLAVSAQNGCGMCVDSHERVLTQHNVNAETIQAAARIAAVMKAVATVHATL